MSPTLLPRMNVILGFISGLAMASGYGVGVFGIWFWSYLQLPMPGHYYQRRMQQIAAGIFFITAVIFLWRASGWQNSLRELMGLEQGPGVQPDRKSTRLNSSHVAISYAVFCLNTKHIRT